MNKYIIGFCVILCAAFAVAQGANTLIYLTDGGAKQVYTSGSTLQIDSGATFTNAGGITQSGTITQTGAVNQDSKLDILSGGEVEISSGATYEFVSGATWTMADGTIPRADLAEDALATFELPITYGWLDSTTKAPLYTPGSGLLSHGAVGTGVYGLLGTAANASTEATTNTIRFTLPENYVAAGDVTFVVTAKCTGAPETLTVDAVIKEVNTTAGTVGSDICATAIQTITSSFVAYSFTVTATGLVAGDVLQIELNTNVIIAAGTDAIMQISNAAVKCDVKG
jgi:hypothetical protein